MTRILVTGGSGALGSEVVTRLKQAGYTPRIMSRRSQPATLPAGVEWAQADVSTGSGLAEAVANVDVIIHAATSPFRRARQVEVEGTRRILEQAQRANVSHLIYVSIVGIDRVPFPYYQHKLAAEGIVGNGTVPWTILRATQFHNLLDRVLQPVARFPFAMLPTDFQFQPVDPGEVAVRLTELVAAGPSGRAQDFGGPEIHDVRELAREWLQVRGLRRPVLHLPLPGKAAYAVRRGLLTNPDHRQGKITWSEWVQRKYAAANSQRLASV
jgi:uncharacterized protein YbjT (DUF2867 family)